MKNLCSLFLLTIAAAGAVLGSVTRTAASSVTQAQAPNHRADRLDLRGTGKKRNNVTVPNALPRGHGTHKRPPRPHRTSKSGYHATSVPLPLPTSFIKKRKHHGGLQDGEPICFDTTYCTSCCCYLPAAISQYSCIWEAAGVTEYVKNYFSNNPVQGKNWVETLALGYGPGNGQSIICTLEAPGCGFSINAPDPTNVDEIRHFLALLAARRWMSYQTAQYNVMAIGLIDFISTDIPSIISDFDNEKQASDVWTEISDGLSIAGAALSLITAPITAGSSLAFGTLFSAALGVAGGLGNLLDSLPDTDPQDFRSLHNYFDNCLASWSGFIEDTADNFIANYTFAFDVLNGSGGGEVWLDGTDEELWKKPSNAVADSIHFYRAWAISKVFKGLGLFMHMDAPGCDVRSTNNNYPGQGCWFFTDTGVASYSNVFAFPVCYLWEPYTYSHTIRQYTAAGALQNWNLWWDEVLAGSYECQYHYSPLQTWGQNMYPDVTDVEGLWADVNAYGSQKWATIGYCLWSLPIANANDGAIVSACNTAQKCCTGYGGHDRNFFAPDWNDDNLAFDDWAAAGLGDIYTYAQQDGINWSEEC